MGKLRFTSEQAAVVKAVAENEYLANTFYFTGGTALSVYYLEHRFSEDLDFFSEADFDDTQVVAFVKAVCKATSAEYRFTRIQHTRIFEIVKSGSLLVKVDFNYYPFKRVEQGKRIHNLQVDSLLDIAINKLLTMNQRNDVKDFVDLYFLRDIYTIWDLMEGVRVKFGMELDQIMVAADMLKAEHFTYLPKMIKPLTLEELKAFFKKRATEVGKTVLE